MARGSRSGTSSLAYVEVGKEHILLQLSSNAETMYSALIRVVDKHRDTTCRVCKTEMITNIHEDGEFLDYGSHV